MIWRRQFMHAFNLYLWPSTLFSSKRCVFIWILLKIYGGNVKIWELYCIRFKWIMNLSFFCILKDWSFLICVTLPIMESNLSLQPAFLQSFQILTRFSPLLFEFWHVFTPLPLDLHPLVPSIFAVTFQINLVL